MALAVVKTTRGPLCGSQQRVQRTHPLGRDLGIGRDAVVGKAVPGGEGQRRDVGGEEGERRLRQCLGARASRATKRTVPSLSAIRASTRPSSPSGHAAERKATSGRAKMAGQRVGGGKPFRSGHGVACCAGMECDDRIEEVGPVALTGGTRPTIQVKSSSSGISISASKSARSWSLRRRYMGIGEGPEKEVHLARAPVPGAEQRPPPARVEIMAGAGGPGHPRSSRATGGAGQSGEG